MAVRSTQFCQSHLTLFTLCKGQNDKVKVSTWNGRPGTAPANPCMLLSQAARGPVLKTEPHSKGLCPGVTAVSSRSQ